MKLMLALIGEQPIPNLLPIRYLKPEHVLMVYSDRTEPVTSRLQQVLAGELDVAQCRADAYDPVSVFRTIDEELEKFGQAEVAVNLTGGTKIMTLAAYQVALQRGIPFLYLQSERQDSYLYSYRFGPSGVPELVEATVIPPVISIDDYLRVHVGNYSVEGKPQNPFEAVIRDCLSGNLDEVLMGVRIGAIEIDLVLRYRNQVGIAEVKTGDKARKKRGLEQLSLAGAREALGIYTAKFLIIDRSWEEQSQLLELAEARSINVIQLPSYSTDAQIISEEDKQKCINEVLSKLSGGTNT